MEELIISSTQNPKIKRLLLLQQKSSERRKEGVFVVEGRRELQHCIEAGYEVESRFSLSPDPIPADAPTRSLSPSREGSEGGAWATARSNKKPLALNESAVFIMKSR